MRIFVTLAVIAFSWIVFAQSCMKFRTSDSLAKSQFEEKSIPFKGSYFKANSTTLHYVEASRDSSLPLLIFVHGSPGSWDAFDPYLKDSMLLLHYGIISIDRPGFGYSDFGKAQNLDQQAKEISLLLHHLSNGKPICLVGHSLGGPMVVKLVADNPDLPINNLVILAGSLDPSEEKPEGWRNTLDRTPLRYLLPGAMRPSNAELLMFKQDVNEMPEALSKVRCRVLIMQGKKDTFVPPGNATYAQQHLTHASKVRIVWFEDENHFIPWTKFNDIRDSLLTLNLNEPVTPPRPEKRGR
ncbi:MAG TPA: alpha/beta hydrolase [Panacibacter sp.]|nr:alpha/beta hydrolase [Panacibacter sp.]HNP46128.1 alpha/beta hydrolase [Panacibacter sp.]